eukprot:5862457-Prymnesium_polylepis.1
MTAAVIVGWPKSTRPGGKPLNAVLEATRRGLPTVHGCCELGCPSRRRQRTTTRVAASTRSAFASIIETEIESDNGASSCTARPSGDPSSSSATATPGRDAGCGSLSVIHEGRPGDGRACSHWRPLLARKCIKVWSCRRLTTRRWGALRHVCKGQLKGHIRDGVVGYQARVDIEQAQHWLHKEWQTDEREGVRLHCKD